MTKPPVSHNPTESASRAFYAKLQTMPRLVHRADPDKPFDLSTSAVLKWIGDNFTSAELSAHVFWGLVQSKVITFDPADRTWRGRDPGEWEEEKAKRQAERAQKRAARLAEKTATKKPAGRPMRFSPQDFADLANDCMIKLGGAPRWPTKAEMLQFCTAPFMGGKPLMSRSTFHRLLNSPGLEASREAMVFHSQMDWLAERQKAWKARGGTIVALPAAGEDDL